MTWREDLAWAAGIIDGEGTIDRERPANPNWRVPRLRVGQTGANGKPEMLLRLQSLLGRSIYGPRPTQKAIWTPKYEWHLGSFEKAQAAIAMMWPWLGNVKRDQARTALRGVRYDEAVARVKE